MRQKSKRHTNTPSKRHETKSVQQTQPLLFNDGMLKGSALLSNNAEEVGPVSGKQQQFQKHYKQLAELNKLGMETELKIDAARLDSERKIQKRFEELAKLTKLAMDIEGKANVEQLQVNQRLQLSYVKNAELIEQVMVAKHAIDVVRQDGEQKVQQKVQQRFEELAALTRIVIARDRQYAKLVHEMSGVIRYYSTNKPFWSRIKRKLRLLLGINVRLIRLMPERVRTLKTGMFDEEWYLEAYPDVRIRGIDPVYHYLKYGVKEWRDPSPFFNTREYLECHKGNGVEINNPLLHYVNQLLK